MRRFATTEDFCSGIGFLDGWMWVASWQSDLQVSGSGKAETGLYYTISTVYVEHGLVHTEVFEYR